MQQLYIIDNSLLQKAAQNPNCNQVFSFLRHVIRFGNIRLCARRLSHTPHRCPELFLRYDGDWQSFSHDKTTAEGCGPTAVDVCNHKKLSGRRLFPAQFLLHFHHQKLSLDTWQPPEWAFLAKHS